MKSLLLGCALFTFTNLTFAQEVKTDSTQQLPADTIFSKSGKKVINIETYSKRFDPRKAMLYSAVLPGMGQVYNKKYWKVPLVIGGLYSLILVVEFYNKAGNQSREDLFDLLNGITNSRNRSPLLGLDETQLRSRINLTQRQRDYFVILTGFFYLLQMVDAHVDAHLKEFALNPKLKVKIEPMMDSNYFTGTSAGIAIKLRF